VLLRLKNQTCNPGRERFADGQMLGFKEQGKGANVTQTLWRVFGGGNKGKTQRRELNQGGERETGGRHEWEVLIQDLSHGIKTPKKKKVLPINVMGETDGREDRLKKGSSST